MKTIVISLESILKSKQKVFIGKLLYKYTEVDIFNKDSLDPCYDYFIVRQNDKGIWLNLNYVSKASLDYHVKNWEKVNDFEFLQILKEISQKEGVYWENTVW